MRPALLTVLCGVLAACSFTAPNVDGYPITCKTNADCQPQLGEVCDAAHGVCVAGPDAGTDGGQGADAGPSACDIQGVAYDAGAFNPAMGCQWCDPRANAGEWSGFTGLAPRGACGSADEVCEDGGCAAGCVISGTFLAKGSSGSNVCQLCDPSKSQTQLQDLTFVPDGGCGTGEVCNAGVCAAGCVIAQTFYAPETGEPGAGCQGCMPNSSVSTWTALTGPAPSGVCNAGEVCNAGACQGGCFVADAGFIAPNALSATGGCVSCQPSVSTSGWKPVADNTGCAGSGFCESGSCEAGCLVGSTFYSSGQSAQGNACAVCDPTGQGGTQGFSPVSTIVACAFDGGDYCSTQGAGQCVQACVVAGKEYDPSAPDPTNPCLSCQPQDSSTSFTDEPQGFGCGPAGSYCNAGSCGVYCDIGGTLVPDAGLDPQNPNQCCNIPLSSTNWSLGFGTQITTPTLTNTPTAFAIGDVTGDNIPDLVVAETGYDIEILAGHGNGTFSSPTQFAIATGSTVPNPVALALADFNNDGHLDIAVANNGGNSVTVLLNQTDGGFAATTISNVKKPTALIVADLQAPGSRDLVVGALSSTIQNPPEVVALVNQGLSGSFAIGPSAPLTEAVVALAVASFSNVAGEVDVAAIGSKNLTIIANASKGAGLSAGTPTAFATATLAGIATGDLNGDNRPDLAVIDQANSQVLSFLNTGSSFAPQTALSVTAPSAIAIGVFTGDGGAPDVAAATGSNNVLVFLNQTTPGATSTSFFTTPPGNYPVGAGPVALAVGDLNGDQRPDLVTASGSNNNLSVLLGQCP